MVTSTDLDYVGIFRQMPEEVQLRVRALLSLRHPQTPFREFITETSPHLPPPPHLDTIIEQVEEAASHGGVRCCVSMPPRHAKTTALLHAFAWWLTNWPADTCAYFSYSDRQARSKSRLANRLALAAGVELDRGSKDMSEWRTTAGGGLLAGGAGGGLTGQGVSGLFVVDDPYKNREQADSLLYRDKIWEWFNEVVFTRLEGANVIVVHTRWHQDDLIGRLAKMGWPVINLPALAEEDDPLGRTIHQALWPERFPEEDLARTRRQIGDWSFASLYQGRPQPRGSNIFQEPARFVLPQTPEEWRSFLAGKYLCIGVDPAASEKTHADYSVAVLMAVDQLGPDANGWILRVVRGQWSVPSFVAQVTELQREWRAKVAAEAVGGFKAVPQLLKQINPNLAIIEVKVTTDKFQRAQSFAAAWNGGRVHVPAGFGADEWVDPYLVEVLSFSGVKDAHDDQVDASAHAWNVLTAPRPVQYRGARRSYSSFG